MNSYATVILGICLVSLVFGTEDSDKSIKELFKIITKALAASGVHDDGHTKEQQIYSSRPEGISTSVYAALQTISKNDDLQCVPRLLCEAAAGGNPGGSRHIIIDKYSLSKLVSYLQLDPGYSSPLLTFGKAIVLGLSDRGDPYSCIVNYPKCPKDTDRLLYYLNNHRGGFFRLFNMKKPQNGYQQHSGRYPHYPGDKYKPSYQYSHKRENEISSVYANKYGHTRVSFPGENVRDLDGGKKLSFPEDQAHGLSGKPIIRTKTTGSERIVFSNDRKNGRKVKGSIFFPHDSKADTSLPNIPSDRLPTKFHESRVPEGLTTEFPEGSFFPDS